MTDINLDQSLGLIVAPGAPSVAEDQSLALIVEQRLQPQTIFNYIDQLLALVVAHRIVDLVQLVGGGYQDFLGRPLANGYLKMKINPDLEVYTNGEEVIEGGISFTIRLDASGNCVPGQFVFANSSLSPAGSAYLSTVYSEDGTTASAPQTITIPNTSATYDMSTFVPLNPAF